MIPFRLQSFIKQRLSPSASRSREFHRPFHSTMPLVVPGLTNASANDTDNKQEWLNKLAGKKISDSTSDVNTFAKKDLPQSHRIIKPGDAMTMDYRQDRLNIHLGEDDIVHDVNFG
ncbi:uncharacterized protein LDX57_003557 [Aspergillus melleus]|uniref:uncharacterized protein n=1 Tax=Aspergillus melleus TaxID=138277 RepID=UPI001E8E65B6|nr:uncharacterized protein LDX57_003557 [Aspergillus melleus]KAH8425813.1 hypothetical protein LDX57_003557 [Aspergillus melleus]